MKYLMPLLIVLILTTTVSAKKYTRAIRSCFYVATPTTPIYSTPIYSTPIYSTPIYSTPAIHSMPMHSTHGRSKQNPRYRTECGPNGCRRVYY